MTEPIRPKVHWDYLCEEMQWLSADFAQERRWKRGVARKVSQKNLHPRGCHSLRLHMCSRVALKGDLSDMVTD